MYLIDTNAISETRKGSRADRGVRQFFDDANRKNADVFISPHPHYALDKLIAATALVHDLTAVTRNTNDFPPSGERLVNPSDRR